MQAVQTAKIDIDLNRQGNIVLRRNNKVEVVVSHPDPRLYDVLEMLLIQQKDYDNFCKYWNQDNLHLASWLTNVLAMDKDRQISWMFEKVIVKYEGE